MWPDLNCLRIPMDTRYIIEGEFYVVKNLCSLLIVG